MRSAERLSYIIREDEISRETYLHNCICREDEITRVAEIIREYEIGVLR